MLVTAGKYTTVRGNAAAPKAASPAGASCSPGVSHSAAPQPGVCDRALARPGLPASPGRAAFDIFTRRAKEMQPHDFVAWWNRELRSGGELFEYCRKEKAQTEERYRAVARKMHGREGFRQNNKSEFRRVADIPLRDYFRWTAQDPDFFNDDRNLKSLKRDNPDACVYI